jgi:hypothetical protein
MTPAPRPRGAPRRPPWQHAVSLRAGLPADRAAWLARVLTALDGATTHAQAAAALGVDRVTAGRWYAWCAAELAAGRLPEHPQPLPPRTAGAHGQPLPSPERAAAGRAKAAATRAAGRAKAAKPRAKRRAKR